MAQAAARVFEQQAVNVDREQRFLAFVNSHRARAVRLAWRLTGGDAAAAEDVAQDAFYRAYKVMAQFREESSPPHGTTESLCARRRIIAVGEPCGSVGVACGQPMCPIRLAIRFPIRASGAGLPMR